MASSTFSVTPGNPIDVTGQARSTLDFTRSPTGRKRSYPGGSADGAGGRDAGILAPQDESGAGNASPPDAPDAHGADTPSSTDAGDVSSKKRKTGRGSRGVANLTPEQLERKRANDREAQRAIRERQRLRTEQYEREIADLKSKQPYQELQGVLRQKEAVEAELAEVKRCLATIVAMVQPMLGGSSHPNRSRPPPVAPPPTAPPTAHDPGSTPTSITSPVSVGTHSRWPSSLSPVAAPPGSVDGQGPQPSPEMAVLHQQRYDLAHGLDLGQDRLALDFLVDPNLKIARIHGGVTGAQDSPQYRHVPMKHDWTATVSMLARQQHQQQQQQQTPSPIYTQQVLPATTALPPSIPYPTTSAAPTTTVTAAAPITTPTTTTPSTATLTLTTTTTTSPNANPAPTPTADSPIYTLTPRNCPPTCPLDSILLDFLAERRGRFAEGLSHAEILGPRYPSVSSLLNPAVAAFSHPLSKVFTDILARFPSIATLPERVAVLYLMFLLMRWQVHPTRENYVRLPSWFRPLRVQTLGGGGGVAGGEGGGGGGEEGGGGGRADGISVGGGGGGGGGGGHPAWYDHIPFPRMRERLVRTYDGPGGFPFDNFFIPFTSTLCVNWPYEDALVLLASPAGDELMINPVFEQHLAQLGNWTLGDAFDRAFPELTGCYNLKRGS